MASDQHVPERLKSKIDESTLSMTENGLHQFYKKFAEFLTELCAEKLLQAEDETIRVLTLNDLKAPLIFCSSLFGFALVVFLIEVIYFKYIGQHRGRVHIQ